MAWYAARQFSFLPHYVKQSQSRNGKHGLNTARLLLVNVRWQLKLITADHKHFAQLADALAIALAVSLPWSTSATAIITALWLLALIPTLDLQSLRRVITISAGGLPVLFVVLGAVGMFWADVPWAERLGGMSSFVKFLVIPLLLHQFYRSDAGRQVLLGFLGSCVVLLVVSWLLWIWPGMPWPGIRKSIGVPVKDYIAQSSMFTFCALVIIRFAYDKWKDGHRRLALALILLAVLFFLNVLYIATSRTYLSSAAGIRLSGIGMERSHRFGCWLSCIGHGSLAFSDVPKRAGQFFF